MLKRGAFEVSLITFEWILRYSAIQLRRVISNTVTHLTNDSALMRRVALIELKDNARFNKNPIKRLRFHLFRSFIGLPRYSEYLRGLVKPLQADGILG